MKRKRKKKWDDKSLREKQIDFRRHLRTYLVMCSFFVIVNLVSVGSIGWAIWPILGWGIGVAMQALSLYGPLADPDDSHPEEESDRQVPLPDLDDRMELRELDRRPYRDEDLV